MSDTVIIYASNLGCTKNTAHYIAEKTNADIFDLKTRSVIDLSHFNRVLIGTGIYAGQPNKAVSEFVKQNKWQLDGRRVGMFICCAKNGESGDEQRKNVSVMLGIDNSVFFAGQRKKIKNRDSPEVDTYIEKLQNNLF